MGREPGSGGIRAIREYRTHVRCRMFSGSRAAATVTRTIRRFPRSICWGDLRCPLHGTHIESVTDEGGTALHWAAWQGKLVPVRYLVARRANPSLVDAVHGSTPLGWCAHQHAELFRPSPGHEKSSATRRSGPRGDDTKSGAGMRRHPQWSTSAMKVAYSQLILHEEAQSASRREARP